MNVIFGILGGVVLLWAVKMFLVDDIVAELKSINESLSRVPQDYGRNLRDDLADIKGELEKVVKGVEAISEQIDGTRPYSFAARVINSLEGR